mmetsp:Transcript_53794/g.73738  ORF Transcript_53794/g.73738 Transcript_53794/m.73738 type:complete len:182 (+) Transcript_53794:139-684(+)
MGLGLLIFLKTQRRKAPGPHIFWAFQLGSFVMAMVWVYFTTNIIVDLLQLFGILTGFSTTLLGLTILSWGNSVGDAIASAAISKKGFGEMALTGCIAGPIFNLMLGLGLTTFKMCIDIPEGIAFDLSEPTTRELLLILVASIVILSTFVCMTISMNYKVNSFVGRVLALEYASVILAVLLL